jgi:ubiquinone/menaquinone biosynthesis C-methylase UbiE
MDSSPEAWHERFVQQAQWTHSLRSYLYAQIGLESIWRVLDVGCGTGALIGELNEKIRTPIYGLDIDLARLKFARNLSLNACLTCSDAHNLPYPRNVFDVSSCHFLLLWVDNPLLVIREMKRVTRPGGAVLAFAEPDYGGRIDYPSELEQLGKMQISALRRQGAEPRLGRQLKSIFRAANFSRVEIGVLGGQWTSPFGGEGSQLEREVLESDLNGIIDELALEKIMDVDKNAWEIGERVLYVPTFYAWGLV